MLASARRDGVRLTVETCPHYLIFDAEEIPDGATQFKCCPPIREAANRERLWAGLRRRRASTASSPTTRRAPPSSSGWTPATSALAWGGISSLQLGLPAVWTEARERGHALTDVVRWMAERPAAQAGLRRQGPDRASAATPTSCVFRAGRDVRRRPRPAAPQEPRDRRTPGRTLRGVVRSTWLRGRTASTCATEPRGRLLSQRRGMTRATHDFTALPDLASRALAGSVVYANDELFAERENLIKPEPAVFSTETFGHKGKVYDGWETRRRREPGYDYAIVRLGVAGVVHGVVVDTAWFKGNYPPYVSVEATGIEGYPTRRRARTRADWVTLVESRRSRGTARTRSTSATRRRFTHVRLTIYPDGGVARLRVHGEPVPDPRFLDRAPRPGRAGERRRGHRLLATCSTPRR